MNKICGYNCEHNKSGVCQISGCDKKSIILDYIIAPNSNIKPLLDKLEQENKILKENAEHNDKVVDKVNWENMLLKKENEQLKDNWNKLKEYIDKMHEYFLYTDVNEIYKQNMKVDNTFPNLFNLSELNASDRILSSICKKMQELEQGSDSNE